MAVAWLVAGVGILVRRAGAWYVSLILSALTLIGAIGNVARNPCGTAFTLVLAVFIIGVLVARKAEYR